MSESDCQETCEGRRRLQDRYDELQDEQDTASSNNYYASTDYTSAAAKILRFVS